MTYRIVFSANALDDVDKLERDEPKAFNKFLKLINELELHPRTGTGRPEQLSGNRSGQWSRRITRKHRLIYEIVDDEVHVDILAAYGHYDDK